MALDAILYENTGMDCVLKRCAKCGNEKALDLFSPAPRGAFKRNAWCKACHGAYAKAKRIPKPPKRKVAGPDGLRECSRCKERKPLTGFYKDSRASDGLKHQCKKCHEAGVNSWSKRNPEKRREIGKRCRNKHGEKYLEKARAYKAREWPKVYAAHRRWVERNRERMLELQRPARRKWKEKNPEAVLEMTHRRRAREAGGGGKYTQAEVRALFKDQFARCANPNCFADLSGGFHRDHIVPLADRGTNFIHNIQLLCPLCNTRKGASPMIVLMARTKGGCHRVHV